MTRRPIVGMLGHVDHGKTTLLDSIRSTSTQANEAGHITQHIGATEIPVSHVESVLSGGLDTYDIDLPGLLVIDTPGHQSFTSLRTRGGSLADIAVLVVDITDGLQPQTHEAIRILQTHHTPFIIAANKIDTVPHWRQAETNNVKTGFDRQSEKAQNALEESVYKLVGQLSDHDVTAELYWKVRDFTNTVAVVPTNARSGTGLPNILSLLFGLSQQYLAGSLAVDSSQAEGTILEVTDEPGFGTVIDALLHSGTIATGDRLAIGGTAVSTTTVRALLKPQQLQDTRAPDTQFERVPRVTAATGVRIAAAHLDDARAGAPIQSSKEQQKHTLTARPTELSTGTNGAVVTGDTRGSVEAVVSSLDERDFPVSNATVGKVTCKDVRIASTMEHSWNSVVIAFNSTVTDKAATVADNCQVDIIRDTVIYRLMDTYNEYVTQQKERDGTQFAELVKPAKLRVLTERTHDRPKSVTVAAQIQTGTLTESVQLIHEPDADAIIGTVTKIQHDGSPVPTGLQGQTVRVTIEHETADRDIRQFDMCWVVVPESHAEHLSSTYNERLSDGEKDTLETYLDRMREYQPFWAS